MERHFSLREVLPEQKKERYRIDENGQEWVLKSEEKRILWYDTGLLGKERWYPLSDLNTDRLILKAAFFGWAGAHRFALHETMQGIFYLLTAGCAGVLPALDILSYLLGNGSVSEEDVSAEGDMIQKSRRYLRKPENKLLAVIGMAFSILISSLLLRFIYLNAFSLLGELISTAMQRIAGSGELVSPL